MSEAGGQQVTEWWRETLHGVRWDDDAENLVGDLWQWHHRWRCVTNHRHIRYPLRCYRLTCPMTWLVKYVGSTRRDMATRLQDHMAMSRASAGVSPVHAWLRELSSRGLKPFINPLPMHKSEGDWIRTMQNAGVPLLNVKHMASVAA